MPRWMVLAFVSVSLVLAGSLTMLYLMRGRMPATGPDTPSHRLPAAATPLTPDHLIADWDPIPAFSLIDQDGRPQTEALLDGRVTIVDFIFTNCPFACPGMTMEMSGLAESLKGTPVRFASFTVDPQRDTPEQLKQFATEHGADTTRWTLLTGDFDTVKRIAQDTLKFAVSPDTSRPIELDDGTTMANVVHPTKLFLVGPDRRLIAMYEYTNPDDMLALKARAKAAAELNEKQAGGGK